MIANFMSWTNLAGILKILNQTWYSPIAFLDSIFFGTVCRWTLSYSYPHLSGVSPVCHQRQVLCLICFEGNTYIFDGGADNYSSVTRSSEKYYAHLLFVKSAPMIILLLLLLQRLVFVWREPLNARLIPFITKMLSMFSSRQMFSLLTSDQLAGFLP